MFRIRILKKKLKINKQRWLINLFFLISNFIVRNFNFLKIHFSIFHCLFFCFAFNPVFDFIFCFFFWLFDCYYFLFSKKMHRIVRLFGCVFFVFFFSTLFVWDKHHFIIFTNNYNCGDTGKLSLQIFGFSTQKIYFVVAMIEKNWLQKKWFWNCETFYSSPDISFSKFSFKKNK